MSFSFNNILFIHATFIKMLPQNLQNKCSFDLLIFLMIIQYLIK